MNILSFLKKVSHLPHYMRVLTKKLSLKGLPAKDSCADSMHLRLQAHSFFLGDTMKLITLAIAIIFAFTGCDKLGLKKDAHKSNVQSKNVVVTLNPPKYTGPATQPVAAQVTSVEVINLTEDNTVTMDQVFDDQSVTTVMVELQRISDKLPHNQPIYLILNTPGGSVHAGLRLVSFAKALPQRVKTLTLFSASMGFQTSQQLDERLILDTGTVMSHRAKFGCQGEGPGEIFECIEYTMSIIDALDHVASGRMKMSFEAYRELIRDEYWAYGQTAVKDKAVDRMVLARCGKGFNKTKVIEVNTMFGLFLVELSKCPLIPGYVSVKLANDQKPDAKALEYVKTMISNKRQFVNEFIVTNTWMKFQK